MSYFNFSKNKESTSNKVSDGPSSFLHDKDFRNLADNHKTNLKYNNDIKRLESRNYDNSKYNDDHKKRSKENERPICNERHRSRSKDRHLIRNKKCSALTKINIHEKNFRKDDNYKGLRDEKILTERNNLNLVDLSEICRESKPCINNSIFKSLDCKNFKSEAVIENDLRIFNSFGDFKFCETAISWPNNMPLTSTVELVGLTNFCPFDYSCIEKPENIEQYFKIIDDRQCAVNYLTQLLSFSELLSSEMQSSYYNEIFMSQRMNFNSEVMWKLELVETFPLCGQVNNFIENDPRIFKTKKYK